MLLINTSYFNIIINLCFKKIETLETCLNFKCILVRVMRNYYFIQLKLVDSSRKLKNHSFIQIKVSISKPQRLTSFVDVVHACLIRGALTSVGLNLLEQSNLRGTNLPRWTIIYMHPLIMLFTLLVTIRVALFYLPLPDLSNLYLIYKK